MALLRSFPRPDWLLQTKLRQYMPAVFFIGGFVWDAVTIGRQVQQSDLVILSCYLLAAAFILWRLAHPNNSDKPRMRWPLVSAAWQANAPYFFLQFLFGSLLSALFILYFKSASHLVAWFWALLLASILIGNEFLEHHYQKNTVAWTMFGFCAILLLNFLLPCLFGTIHWLWFMISTVMGALGTHFFYYKVKTHAAPAYRQMIPTWILALILMLAYVGDMIPPVPLVRLDTIIGTDLQKNNGRYTLNVDHRSWRFWRYFSHELHIKAGEKAYCMTAIFAPEGLRTRLYHHWEYYNGQRWIATPRIGFMLNGGRLQGYRGYTYKQNLQSGDWRVVVETEGGHTVSVDKFTLVIEPAAAEIARKARSI